MRGRGVQTRRRPPSGCTRRRLFGGGLPGFGGLDAVVGFGNLGFVQGFRSCRGLGRKHSGFVWFGRGGEATPHTPLSHPLSRPRSHVHPRYSHMAPTSAPALVPMMPLICGDRREGERCVGVRWEKREKEKAGVCMDRRERERVCVYVCVQCGSAGSLCTDCLI
jgi:hypothetical protein